MTPVALAGWSVWTGRRGGPEGARGFTEHSQMVYRVLADLVLGLHLAFVLFVVLGGLLVLRWRQTAWIHIPAALWGAFIECSGGICPLTPLENWLRTRGGAVGYSSSFIEYYILPVLYPATLTRELQVALGAGVLVINIGMYGWMLRRAAKAGRRPHAPRPDRAERNT